MDVIMILKQVLQYWRQIGIALIAIILVFGGYNYGVDKTTTYYEKKAQEQAQLEQKKQEQFDQEKRVIASQYEQWRETHPVIRNVDHYITKVDDSACKVNVGFVKLHEDALYKPYETQQANDEDSHVTLSQIGEVMSYNYHVCQNEIQKLKSLQDLIRKFNETN